MKPLHLPCSYCKNNKKKSICSFLSSSLSGKGSSQSRTKNRSCGNTNQGANLHRFSIERLIKRTSLFSITASADTPNNYLKNVSNFVALSSLVQDIKDDGGSFGGEEGGGNNNVRSARETKLFRAVFSIAFTLIYCLYSLVLTECITI